MGSKQQLLDQLKAKIIRDNVCPELAAQATQLVFGDGNPNSDIVFIGEAPGKNEDLQGRPFVGAAGKFLDEMLQYIDLKREHIYITNIVKYRPQNNRDPLPEEKHEFLPYLQAQLEIIQPKIVVTLGRHSMNCFLPDLQISKVHGMPKRIRIKRRALGGQGDNIKNVSASQRSQGANVMQGDAQERTDIPDHDRIPGQTSSGVHGHDQQHNGAAKGVLQTSTQQHSARSGAAGEHDVMSLVILPLFHPAAALYNGGMRQTLIDDFTKLPAIIEQL